MADRTVTDAAGRIWTCAAQPPTEGLAGRQGQDVVLMCATPSVAEPVRLTVGWQWEKMAPHGLARLISHASPVPKS
jgi:hypothetical protein